MGESGGALTETCRENILLLGTLTDGQTIRETEAAIAGGAGIRRRATGGV